MRNTVAKRIGEAEARAVRPADSRRAFSFGWIFVSYFMICGGMVVGILATGYLLHTAQLTDVDPRLSAYLACGGGAALGGFFAGRSSSHFSILEPAIAGGLVIGSIFALVKWTALGPLVFSFAESRITRESLVLGGLASGGGLVGALAGEVSSSGTPSPSWLRWLGMAVFLTAGALLASTIASNVLLADRTLKDPQLIGRLLSGQEAVSDEDVMTAAMVALIAASFLGGLITQLAAPRRLLTAAALGVYTAIAGGLIGIMALGGPLEQDSVVGAVVIGAGAGILGLLGALLAWLLCRLTGRAGMVKSPPLEPAALTRGG